MDDVTSILWLSVLLQGLAAYLALRLIPITGGALAWSVLSLAFLLMATRRAVSLLHDQGTIQSDWLHQLSTETIALVISFLIVIGVYLIRGIFLEKQADELMLRKLSMAVEQNPSSTLITDSEGRIEYANPAFLAITGYETEEIIGQTPGILKSSQTDAMVFVQLWETIKAGNVWKGEFCNTCKNGEYRWERALISPVKNPAGKITHYVCVLEDITEHKAQREALEYMAMHDALTDLPNRSLFYDRVSQAILDAGEAGNSVMVMLMDLNDFKIINDTLGHHAGDRILKKVAERIRDCADKSDTVARMGGDEFLLLTKARYEEEGLALAKKIVDAFHEPFIVDSHKLEISASIGIASFPKDGDDPDQLIQKADVAMYAAKHSADHVEKYQVDQDRYSVGRLEMLSDFRESLKRNNELILHYQPSVSLASKKVVGVEALIRWQHPKQGLLYPNEFVPVLEEVGLIRSLTRWVIEESARQMHEWAKEGIDVQVSINVSTKDLLDPGFVSHLQESLQKYDLAPSRMVVEITERVLMLFTQQTASVLQELNRHGVRISIDDFGTGYSSLQYLKEMPVSELKIDRSFVMEMMANENDAVIVRSTVDLAHNLGLKVVAEGVESRELMETLFTLGCDYAQGYYISKPVNAGQIRQLIELTRT